MFFLFAHHELFSNIEQKSNRIFKCLEKMLLCLLLIQAARSSLSDNQTVIKNINNFRLIVGEMTLANEPEILIKLALKRGLQVQLSSLTEFRQQTQDGQDRKQAILDAAIREVTSTLNRTIADLFSLQHQVIPTDEIVTMQQIDDKQSTTSSK